jgi:hypothetical protein
MRYCPAEQVEYYGFDYCKQMGDDKDWGLLRVRFVRMRLRPTDSAEA